MKRHIPRFWSVFARSLMVLWAIPWAPPAQSQEPTRQQIDFFESKVRPILVDNCYQCHAADAEEIEGGLLLDSRWGWQKGGDSGPAIVAGDVDQSLLIEAIRYEEDVLSGMPPKSKLPQQQIAILEKWVAMGAPDPREKASPSAQPAAEFDLQARVREHWSWRPIRASSAPAVSDQSWPLNDIDRFILARLEAAKLLPAPPADKRTWLRRVYFDLIGLPPTLNQITDFLSDDSPEAHQRVVTRLLDSPQFGEKWARHWMDLVRYAETYGHEFDYEVRYAHEYRDYLIRAFNADVPYDQIVREHIAGDLISQPRRHPTEDFNESIIGTGFWYWHEATHAPTDVLANEADIVDNQLDVFGKAFLGLTVSCARCHDHKFDAISTADYYALSAYLQSSCRQDVPLDPDRQRETARPKIDQLVRQASRQLQQISPQTAFQLRPGKYYEVASRLKRRAALADKRQEVPEEWIASAAKEHQLDLPRLIQWVQQVRRVTLDRRKPSVPLDDSILFADFDAGEVPEGWSTSGLAFQAVGAQLTPKVDGGLASAGTIDSGVAGKQQVGILRSPTFKIPAEQIHVRVKATENVTIRVIIDNYYMAHYNPLLFRGTFLNAKDTDTAGKWQWKSLSRDMRKYVGHRAFLEFVDDGDGTIAIDEIRFSNQSVRRTAPTATRDHAAYVNDLWRQGIDDIRSGSANEMIASILDAKLLSVDQLNRSAGDCLAEARDINAALPAPRFAVAMAQGTTEGARVYIRGSHTNLGEQVPPRFLTALGSEQGSRLHLANLIASDDNPLTARVIVNRLWQHLLGRGIVPTVDDFGPQGQAASHPKLLDWLAQDLIDNGWSLKQLIGQIVMSQTYRQQSVANQRIDPDLIATTDPTNALLHRARVRRLPSEAIRDAIMSVSGRLDLKQFGPSVATYRTPFMTGRGARQSGPMDGNGRRSVYLSIYRNFLNPFMLTFDMPNPFGPQGRRSQSNVPAQALTLMNDPFVSQQAAFWAQSVLQRADLSDRERVASMVQQAHGVEISSRQTDQLLEFVAAQAETYRELGDDAGDGARVDLAWVDLAHALLNMKAFYFLQ